MKQETTELKEIKDKEEKRVWNESMKITDAKERQRSGRERLRRMPENTQEEEGEKKNEEGEIISENN